ncbi:MAG: metallophosphoesterase family protein [Tissierellia bacterium]|nr:metallophosphoesterase family protein [Tissierellia bacterium]
MRFLHMADNHLGRSYDLGQKDKRDQSRQDRFDNFKAILDLAKKSQLDALILAGDIIEGDFFLSQDMYWFLDQLEGLAPLPCYYVLGNHDFLWGQYVTSSLTWPRNVHVFSSHQLGHFDDEKNQVRFMGQSWSHGSGAQTLDLGEGDFRPGYQHILIHHGHFGGRDYFPISPQAPWLDWLDYVALGHIHKYEKYRGHIVNPGTPEPLMADDLGEKYVLLGDLGPHQLTLKPLSLQKRELKRIDFTLEEDKTFSQALGELKKALDPAKDIYQVRLGGYRKEEDFLEALKAQLRDQVFGAFFSHDFEESTYGEVLYRDQEEELLGRLIQEVNRQDLEKEDRQRVLDLAMEALLKSGEGHD